MANDDPVDDENPRSNTTNNSINDNKLAEVFDMVSVHKHQYKMPTFAFHTNKTITEVLHRPLLRAQASMVTTS
ncbi:hypothetical protein Zm00014a_017571 [Zea mays]|uniref:Uncharacterized protein n=2 Tax=Zea mays TaxID=4577 RepID=A0A3L6DKZ2_MAIZE|nr:hypothetical protein [Zea mays]PWZ09159.1 hypothetical protein Zm00014a_017571 [Zea mays]